MKAPIPRISLAVAALSVPACDLALHEVKTDVARSLIDPSSAQFDQLKKYQVDGTLMVCGTVNGKNRFGAMAGARRFIYIKPLFRIASTEQEDFAIYTCCQKLGKAGTKGDAGSTSDIEECSGIDPPMPI